MARPLTPRLRPRRAALLMSAALSSAVCTAHVAHASPGPTAPASKGAASEPPAAPPAGEAFETTSGVDVLWVPTPGAKTATVLMQVRPAALFGQRAHSARAEAATTLARGTLPRQKTPTAVSTPVTTVGGEVQHGTTTDSAWVADRVPLDKLGVALATMSDRLVLAPKLGVPADHEAPADTGSAAVHTEARRLLGLAAPHAAPADTWRTLHRGDVALVVVADGEPRTIKRLVDRALRVRLRRAPARDVLTAPMPAGRLLVSAGGLEAADGVVSCAQPLAETPWERWADLQTLAAATGGHAAVHGDHMVVRWATARPFVPSEAKILSRLAAIVDDQGGAATAALNQGAQEALRAWSGDVESPVGLARWLAGWPRSVQAGWRTAVPAAWSSRSPARLQAAADACLNGRVALVRPDAPAETGKQASSAPAGNTPSETPTDANGAAGMASSSTRDAGPTP